MQKTQAMGKFDPWVGKIPWRRKWQPTPVLLPQNSHGQRHLVGYSPCGRNKSDTTVQLIITSDDFFMCSFFVKHAFPFYGLNFILLNIYNI